MLPQLGVEDPQGAADQADDAGGMSAAAAAVDLAKPPAQQAGIGAAAVSEPLDLAGDRIQAEPAGAALAGGFAGQVANHPGGLLEPAGACGQCRDQAGSGPGTEVREPRR